MSQLKGVLIAAGRGNDDLAPTVSGRCAEVFPVANRPLIEHAGRALVAAGAAELIALVSPATAPDVREAVGDGLQIGAPVRYVEVPEQLGDTAALAAAAPVLDGSPALVLHADALLEKPLGPAAREFERSGVDLILLAGQRDAAEASASAAAHLELVEDAGPPISDAVLAPAFLAGPAASEAAAADPGRSLSALGGAVADAGSVRTRAAGGWWRYEPDVDELLAANRRLLDRVTSELADVDLTSARIEGRVGVHSSAVVERTTVRGPALIGPGAVLIDAYVGPYTSIGENVHLEGAEIEYSIVLGGATIRHLGRRVEASLVGRDAEVRRDFKLPNALRLRVGRRADIALT